MKTETKGISTRFVLNGDPIILELRIEPAQMIEHGKTIDLKPIPKSAKEISVTGQSTGHCGQMTDQLRGSGVAELNRICELWDRWHLNGMKAGNRKQLEYIEQNGLGGDYDAICKALGAAGLLEVDGYKYGSAWLYEPVPAKVVNELKKLFAKINGKRFGKAVDVSDAPDMDGDVIDSRDVVKRLEAYREALEAAEEESDEWNELNDEVEALEALEALEDAGIPDWKFGATLIKESHFREYAEQYAEDIGAVNSDATWPNCHIDWEAAADTLRTDYTEVEYRGTTYLVR